MDPAVIPGRIFGAACDGNLEEVEAFLASVASPRDVVGLANRGKIRSADPALNNLVALPNELICQVLAYWFG